MTRRTAFLLCLLALVLEVGTTYAQEKQVHINKRILSAKTVCLVPARKAKQEIEKWRRFTIVTDPDAADLVFKFSEEEHDAGYRTIGSMSGGMVATRTAPIVKGTMQLRVLDAKTNEVLWDTARGGGSKAAARLVKELRRQIERAEKQGK